MASETEKIQPGVEESWGRKEEPVFPTTLQNTLHFGFSCKSTVVVGPPVQQAKAPADYIFTLAMDV